MRKFWCHSQSEDLKLKYSKIISATALSVFLLQGCNDDNDPVIIDPVNPVEPSNTIVDVAIANGNFTTLVAALEAADLVGALSDPDVTYTVFAPTDAAFDLLGEDAIADLLAQPETLADILTYHVLDGEVNAEAAIGIASSADNAPVAMLNMDSVGLSYFNDTLFINTSSVTMPDVEASNGIIHVIDAVLMPPADRMDTTDSIVDVVVGSDDFDTLEAALIEADLVSTLANTDTKFTVFAPTDDAFALIDEKTLDALIADKDALSAVLLQHVITEAEVDSVTAYTLNGKQASTASGAMIDININPITDALTFGGANIISRDVYTTNGIIHVIDAVVIGDVELPTPPLSIVDVALGAPEFTTLVAALEAADLVDTLANLEAEYTVFAPTNAAFEKLPEGKLEELLADPEALENILLYHVLGDTVLSDAAISVAGSMENTIDMANGDKAALSLVGNDLYINGALISSADTMAANGVIHTIDNVILPIATPAEAPTMNIAEVAVSMPDTFSTLVEALTEADLVDTLSDEDTTFTVFAPTDDAFDKIDADALAALLADTDALTNVLLTHVVGEASLSSVDAYGQNGKSLTTVSGGVVAVSVDADTGMLMIGDAKVIISDVQATNGTIHVIDTVIMPDAEPALGSIVDVALASAPEFSTLVAALTAADLVDTLADLETNYTVFAPTNAAFEKLPEGRLEELLADPEALANILLYHVASGTVLSDAAISVAGSMDNMVEMVNGDKASLSLTEEGLFVNGAIVSSPDNIADNGVIHAIDNVILPIEMTTPTMNIAQIAVSMPETFSTLVEALTEADLVDTLSDEDATFTVFAPTDDAFAKIDADALAALLEDTDALTTVLLNHVIGGESYSSVDAYSQNGKPLGALSGALIYVAVDSETGDLMIGDTKVIIKDVQATNGTIHVIDTVIM